MIGTLVLSGAILATGVSAGSFVPAPLFGEGNVEVITRSLARETLDRDLFGTPYDGVVVGQTDIYDGFPYVESRCFLFVSDPEWNRILFGEIGKGFDAWNGEGTIFGKLDSPRGMAVDAEGNLYVADSGNRRILVFRTSSEFDRARLHPLYEISGLARPYDVTHSDRGTPDDPSDDVIYVADMGKNRVVRFSLLESGAVFAGEIGALGSGPGRFAGPSAIAVGRFDGVNTSDVFVADAHNGRFVRLVDDGERLTWHASWKGDSGVITSLDSDHWGNLYATSPQHGRVVKYGADFSKVAEWTDGINRPRSFHIPFLRVTDHRSGRTVRAGQGSGVLVEEWTAASGLRLAHFGVEVKGLSVRSGKTVSADYVLTDRADVRAVIIDERTNASLIEYELGVLDAGSQQFRIPVDDLVGRSSHGEMVLRIVAYSSYDQGSGGEMEARFSYGSGSDSAPARSSLLVATPNPFNPVTTIRFEVRAGQDLHVNLSIYDIGGRMVRTLQNGPLDWGKHSLVWDGRNDTGQPVASGIYTARLDLGDEERRTKMVLIR